MLFRMTETEAKWVARVADWRESGKSAEEFAEGRGFQGSTLRVWASRLKTKNGDSTVPRLRIARVVRGAAAVSTVPEVDAGIVVELGRARINVRRGFDPSVLRAVVESLQGPR